VLQPRRKQSSTIKLFYDAVSTTEIMSGVCMRVWKVAIVVYLKVL
jgi:hypothetical protein